MEYGGIYIHIPFCIKKCSYCNFYSIADLSYAETFSNALQKEIKGRGDKNFVCDTIYFGGGTPSILSPKTISAILRSVYDSFTILPNAEITIETNPGAVNSKAFVSLYKAGINRINIGVQSFNDANLKFLQRIHTAKEGIVSYEAARKAGFENVGIDFIYGIPNQSLFSWINDLKRAVELSPEHISCYLLTLESGSAMYHNLKAGLLKELDDKLQGKMFLSAIRFLENNGYKQYEISNFSQNNLFKSLHNSKYWSGAQYKGFGASAHSFEENRRYWNIADVKEYIERLNKEESVVEETETLTKEQRVIEFIYLGLRTQSGINIKRFNAEFDADFLKDYDSLISKFIKEKLMKINNDCCILTQRGMLLSDSIAKALT